MATAESESPSRLSVSRLLSGSIWAFGGRGVGTVLALLINAFLARLLTPDELGAYFLAFSVVTVLVLVAQVGGKPTMVRLVAASLATDRPGRARAAAERVVLIGFLGSLTVGLAWWLLGGELAGRLFESEDIARVSGLIAIWVGVLALAELHTEGHRALGDIRAAVLLGWVANNVVLVLALAIVVVAGLGFGFRAALVVSIIGAAVTLVIGAGALWRRLWALPRGQMALREVLTVSAPLLGTHLLLFVVGQSGLWILGALRPEAEVALYGAAFRLVTVVKMPLLIANAVVPPFISDYHARGDIEALETTLRGTATLAALPALVLLAVFAMGGAPILGLVFGDPYRDAALLLAVLSLGQAVNVWAGSADLTLMLTGHQVPMLTVTAISGSLGIVGAIWAGTQYGAVGVAWAAASTWLLQAILMLWLARRLVGVRVGASFTPASLKAAHQLVMQGLRRRRQG